MIAGIPFPCPVTRRDRKGGDKGGQVSATPTRKKCLSSGINAAAAPACDSRLCRIYITRRANVGKQNKQQKKELVKIPQRLQPEDNPGEGGEPSVVKSDS